MYLAQPSLAQRARQSILRILKIDPITIEFSHRLQLPIVNYGTRRGVFIGRQISPLTVTLYACRELRLESIIGQIPVPRLRGTETPEYVDRAVRWLLSNEKRGDHFHTWQYDFPWPDYSLRPPWRSALMEAYGALLLLMYGKPHEARRHLESMLTDYREGGVSYIDKGVFFPLEYVSDRPILVLNGILRCLLILHECGARLDGPDLKRAFDTGYESLKSRLEIFDAGCYTYYDSLGTPADRKYHSLHVELLGRIYERNKDRDLLPIYERWARYKGTYPIAEPIALLRHLIRSKGNL